MQHMQDKEFDELFRDRFESAEIEPSANLWSNIEGKLTVKRKRIFPLYWSAAAAIIAAVTVALLFQKTDKIQLNGTAVLSQQTVKGHQDILTHQPNGSDRAVPSEKKQGTNQYASVSLQHNTEVEKRPNNLTANLEVLADEPDNKKDLLAMQPSVVISHLEYKEAKLKQEPAKLPKAITPPVEDVMLASADVTSEVNTEADNDEVGNENKRAESKGIRNMGDLINYVVDKVDKRDEKFIQFKTDDDDNSSLIGLNIGMFKFSQKKHK